MLREKSDIKSTRRSYTKHFKREVVAECAEPGQSISGVALKYKMNANIVHKWVRLAEAGELTEQTPAFIPIPVRGNIAAINAQIIDIEIVRGEAKVNLRWPTQDSAACGAWLCEWLR